MKIRVRNKDGDIDMTWEVLSIPRIGERVDLQFSGAWRVIDVQWIADAHGLLEVCVWLGPDGRRRR